MDRIIAEALREDIGRGDITTRLVVPAGKTAHADVIAKGRGVFCGLEVARQILSHYKLQYTFVVKDGQQIHPGQILGTITGDARSILTSERTLLNFVQHLSGVATLTNLFVERIKPFKAKIYDTRKTIPGLRKWEKYAVRCGGGYNHRFGLYDMILLKDNHLKLLENWESLVERLKRKPKGMKVEIEAENLYQVKYILQAGIADMILLDNMSSGLLKKAIKYIRDTDSHIEIEVSGGVNLSTVRNYAALGVDRISVGALTHSVAALDISLEFKGAESK